MRIERWYWLLYFCLVSLAIHIAAVLRSRSFDYPMPFTPPKEMQVALEPLTPKHSAPTPAAKKPRPKPVRMEIPKIEEPPPVRHLEVRTPRVVTLRRIRVARLPRTLEVKTPPPLAVRTVAPPREAPRIANANFMPGGPNALKEEKPEPIGVPFRESGLGIPRLRRIARVPPMAMAGGSPAPGVVLSGHGGAPGPESPPQDVMWNGGGSGGADLPRAAPRIGGGGGRSILSVNNPLAHEAIPEDRPGIGPGTGGGQGAGSGGGVGFAHGGGIGTRPGGRYDLAALQAGEGEGIGAGTGSGIGTRAPGGGRGTGSELPGTGGAGTGYGRGEGEGFGTRPTNSRLLIADNPLAKETAMDERPGYDTGVDEGGAGKYAVTGLRGKPGPGLGNGIGAGIGNGQPGARREAVPERLGRGGTGLGNGSGPGAGTGARQIETPPDNPEKVADVLRGAGRGAVFGVKPIPGTADGPLHIVYAIDVSDSMNLEDKIGKSRRALKHALSELEPRDTFDVVAFGEEVNVFRTSMSQASKQNIAAAQQWVDAIDTSLWTDLGAGLQTALGLGDVSHILLLSDGEPTKGIRDETKLRLAVRKWNRNHAQIIALSLRVSSREMNSSMLEGIAEDNGGSFTVVNLTSRRGR